MNGAAPQMAWCGRKKRSPAKLAKLMKDAGKGVSEFIEDRAFWLGRIDLRLIPWIVALEDIDKRDDTAPLVSLLRSRDDLPHEARVYLADLIDRQIKKRRGAPREPAYNQSSAEAMLKLGKRRVSDLVKRTTTSTKRTSVKDALERVSKSLGIPVETLASAYSGRRGSTRRMDKRRPQIPPKKGGSRP